MTDRDLLQQARDALADVATWAPANRLERADAVIAAIDARLAQPEAQPVAKVLVTTTGGNPGIAWFAVAVTPGESLPLLADDTLLYTEPPPAQPAEQAQCVGRDPYCPCQDGDACHYVDTPGSPAMPIPPAQPAEQAQPAAPCPHCAEADRICNSYAAENQRFSDEVDRLSADIETKAALIRELVDANATLSDQAVTLRSEIDDHIRRSDNMEAELEGLRRELNQAINDADRAIEHARRVDGKERERLHAENEALRGLLNEAETIIDHLELQRAETSDGIWYYYGFDRPQLMDDLCARIRAALKAQEGKA